MDIPTCFRSIDSCGTKVWHLLVQRGATFMNAQAILSYFSFSGWRNDPPKKAKDFPPEAYSYDDPIDPKIVAAIQEKANEKLDQQQWTVIERIGDGANR
jgi:hypothetical protein